MIILAEIDLRLPPVSSLFLRLHHFPHDTPEMQADRMEVEADGALSASAILHPYQSHHEDDAAERSLERAELVRDP